MFHHDFFFGSFCKLFEYVETRMAFGRISDPLKLYENYLKPVIIETKQAINITL